MATKRQAILDGLVTAIQAANGVAPYVYDLSGTDVVSQAVEPRDTRLHFGVVSVRVQDSGEARELRELNTWTNDALLDMRVSCLVKDNSNDKLVKQLNMLLGDVTRAVGASPTLGGTCVNARIFSIDEPSYDAGEQKHGHAFVRVRASYTFDAAVEA